MPNVINFYTDIDFSDIAMSAPVGVASIVKPEDETKPDLTILTNWQDIGQYTYDTGYYRKIYRQSINGQSGIGLGGTGAIATIFSPENWVTGENPKLVDGIWKNCFFIDVHDIANNPPPNIWRGIYLEIFGSQYEDSNNIWHFNPVIRIGNYRAIPDNEISTKSERTGYKYYTGVDYEFAAEASSFGWNSNSQFNQIAMYSCVVEETEFFMFVMGVNNGTLHPTNTVTAVLIPKSYFKYRIPKPYVGPVSKDSAATSFTPTTPFHDSIAGRDLTGKRNPVGFNSGNGLRLLQLDNAGYSQILYGIYSGSSSSLLNYAGQLIDQVTGGEGHRPAEEVQPMTQGVLCCHIVPAISTYGSGIYNLKSIAGYRLSLAGVPGLLCGQHIYSYTSPAVSVAPRLNSFLDYEPYTSIICHLPFFGDISVSPSALLGNAIQAEYELDIYTGILSCNIFIITPESRYIISTQQSKISTDLPVIGAAANQNAIGTIAQATGGLARARMQQARAQEIGTQAEQAAAAANTAASAAAGAITTVDALSRAGNAVPVGGSSVEGIGNYLVSRAAYLIITRPQPSLPENFAQLYGAVSNISGTVSSFAGYTEFAAVDLRGIDATDAEKAQILALLRGGVFI